MHWHTDKNQISLFDWDVKNISDISRLLSLLIIYHSHMIVAWKQEND